MVAIYNNYTDNGWCRRLMSLNIRSPYPEHAVLTLFYFAGQRAVQSQIRAMNYSLGILKNNQTSNAKILACMFEKRTF